MSHDVGVQYRFALNVFKEISRYLHFLYVGTKIDLSARIRSAHRRILRYGAELNLIMKSETELEPSSLWERDISLISQVELSI
jgi:hypothetical protein